MQLVIVRSDKNWWDKEPKVQEHVIESDTVEGLYAIAFREFFNRTKYCNGTEISFKDPSHNEPYNEWISNTDNYANNGGDMW